jgi:hypothetical protein
VLASGPTDDDAIRSMIAEICAVACPEDGLRFDQMPELATCWRDYLAAGAVLVAPPAQFADVGERIIEYLGPVRDSIVAGAPHAQAWPAGGPWQPRKETSP